MAKQKPTKSAKRPAAPERPSTVVVPDLRGMALVDAVILLRKLPLRVEPQGPSRVDPEVARGCVIESDPPAGAEVRRLASLTLAVSLGTVSDWLQSYIDAPTNAFNEVELPPGEHELDRPLVIRRQRTKIRRQDKFGGNRVELVAPKGQPVFEFAYAGPVPDARASVIWSDEPDVEITEA